MLAGKIMRCIPFRAAWQPVEGARCGNPFAGFIFDRVVAIVTDLIILLVPIPLVWRMQALQPRKKIQAILMLGAGGIATLVTIARLCWGLARYLSSNNFTFDYAIVNITA